MIDVLDLLGDDELEAHTSVVITYELDLTLYEGLIHRTLKGAGVVNQMVFCDLRMYIPELDGVTNLRGLGRKYSVTPILAQGAFHPKLYLLLGRQRGRLLVGSGNATTGGLLRNAELFGSFDYDATNDAAPHPAFGTCIDFIRDLAAQGAGPVRRQLERALAWTPWITRPAAPDGRELLLSGPGRPPLLEQIRPRLAGRVIEGAVVCSGSFDRRLEALRSLASLTGSGQLDCIVSHERVDLDGKAVRQTRKEIMWRPFVEPVAKARKSRRDARLHAKLFVFLCEDADIAMYGSANASSPALLTDTNTEALVVLPPLPPGSVVEHLGLEESLGADALNTELEARDWPEQPADELSSYPVILSAATASDDGVVLAVARGKPDADAQLALSRSTTQAPKLVALLTRWEGGFRAGVIIPEGVALAWLVGSGGQILSNPVSLTWPDVAERSMSTGFGAKVEGALGALMDGFAIGTILFELLSQVPDFEVVLAGGRGGSEASDGDEEEEPSTSTGSGEVFYTDAVAGRDPGKNLSGDTGDLEILARLIQPLRGGPANAGTSLDDEDEDIDAGIAEEARRRALDAKREDPGGKDADPSKPNLKTVERAKRRLERRLERAAGSLESALAARRRLTSLAPASIARQLWMLRIAAALADREVPTKEGPVCCLEPIAFAEYVLRVSRALAGGKDEGLLALLPAQVMMGPDGQILREGLRFLWSCTIWAAAIVVDFWKKAENADDLANDVHDAAPELVAARFVRLIDRYCDEPDLSDIERRFPGWNRPGQGWFVRWEDRLNALATRIGEIESDTAPARRLTSSLEPGALVVHPSTGLTILAAREERKLRLLDLSRVVVVDEKRDLLPLRIFTGDVTAVIFKHPMGPLTWRAPGWLEET